MTSPPVIVTRTQPGNTRTVRAVRAMGLKAIACPVSQVVRTRARIEPGPAGAIALTSANGLRALTEPASLLHLPVFTVGEGTARAAREAGFASVTSAGGDAEGLARLIAASLNPRTPVLHLSGEDRAGDLAGMLEVLGYAVTTRTVYRTRLARGLTTRTRTHLFGGDPAIVLIHSARGAERFVTLVDEAQLSASLARLTFIAISDRAAVPLHAKGLRVITATEPGEESLLHALRELAKPGGAP